MPCEREHSGKHPLGKLGLRAVLVDHVGALAGEQASGARAGDVLVAISFTPYTPATVELATAHAARNLPVVAITDIGRSRPSPMSRRSGWRWSKPTWAASARSPPLSASP